MNSYLRATNFFIIIFFVGCAISNKSTRQNIADLYLPKDKLAQSIASFKFIKDSESISLFFKLNTLQVVNYRNNFDAKLRLSFYNNTKTTLPIREIIQPIRFSNLQAQFTINVIDSYDLISYNLASDNFLKPLTGFLQIDELNGDDLFLLKEENPINASYLKINNNINFNEESVIGAEGVLVKYYETINDIALPPYITDVERIFKPVELTASITLNEKTFTPKKNGYYLFESMKKQKGYLCIDENFPGLKDYQTFALSLRYITKNEELIKLLSNKNIEEAIDNFWLAVGKNKARGFKLKNEYLLRLETSNQYFSGIKLGWQTDRGMIYTIFGPPNEVYKTEEGENWYFKDLKVEFKFIKKVVLKNYNTYQLQRNENLALYWHQAVNKWRNGHIKSTEVLE